jgi:threonine aldolase
LSEVDGLLVDLETVQSNMAFFTLVTDRMTPPELLDALDEEGVKVSYYGAGLFRAVAHHGIEEEDIHHSLDAFRRVMHGKA